MTPCLRPEEFVDALDGTLAPARAAHEAACPACGQTLADLRTASADAQADDVPEPSPFYWPSVNARVRAAIDDAPRGPLVHGAAWQPWRRWAFAVPLAGLAALVVVLVSAVSGPDPRPLVTVDTSVDLAAAADPGADSALALVVDLASALDDDVDALGVPSLPDLGEVAAATLSADEQDALRALLQSAVERPPS